MFLVDPPPTAADLRFRLFGFPIRVTPWFWLAAVLLSIRGDTSPEAVLTWVAVVFVSILLHELGHAFAIRSFGGHSRVTLYHFGGLAMDDRVDRSAREQIIISLAGPVAGFLLAGIVVTVLAASGHLNGLRLSLVPIDYDLFDRATIDPTTSLVRLSVRDQLVWDLLFVNFAWGLVNLLPIYPLDGGRVSREIFVELNGGRGIVQSLWLSVIAAGVFAVYSLFSWGGLFVPIMFGMLAFSSYQMLQAYLGRGGRMW